MDGFELARRIRRDEDSPNPYVPIILCTGYTELGLVIAARDAGVNEVLAKPITANTLYNRIRTIIEEPRQFVQLDSFLRPRPSPEGCFPSKRSAGSPMRAGLRRVPVRIWRITRPKIPTSRMKSRKYSALEVRPAANYSPRA